MKTNYREMLGMDTLCKVLAVESLKDLNLHQKKARKNIKYCADDQWQFVNSWYDCEDEGARAYMMNAEELFSTIYHDSQENVYDEGCVSWGGGCKSFLKDVRFCGKKFLETVSFYYTVKLMEESVPEVDGTEEDAERVFEELKVLKARIIG